MPKPTPTELIRSDKLKNLIKQNIKSLGGAISFADYMRQALYTPELGYYNSEDIDFGPTGDFITAPEISNLFSQVIAKQITPSLQNITEPAILEFGAGSGKMATEILAELNKTNNLPQQYFILETSQHLQQLQHQNILTKVPDLLERVTWISQLPNNFAGIILANEVMDAMPFERFVIEDSKTFKLLVSDDFKLVKGHEVAINLPEPIAEYANGYTAEYSNLIQPWVKSIMDCLNQGLVLLLDYGYEEFEYYHPARNTGSLQCFYKHYKHQDPFLYPGLCDITAHVNFSTIADTSKVCAFLYQAEFLIYGGITELAENSTDMVTRAKISKAIQTLTAPNQMGETIKVLALCKNIPAPDFI